MREYGYYLEAISYTKAKVVECIGRYSDMREYGYYWEAVSYTKAKVVEYIGR
jgi:hypothetical protein